MTTPAINENGSKIRTILEWLKDNKSKTADRWFSSLDSSTNYAPTSLKSWISGHDTVETLQVTYGENDSLNRIWAPGPREIEHFATFARFDGSRRDYAGVLHLAHSRDTWIGWDSSANTLIAYSAL